MVISPPSSRRLELVYALQLYMGEQLQRAQSHREPSLSSPSQERLRAWRLFFESSLALIDVLDSELERDIGLSLPFYDVLVHLEETPDGLRMNELAERILYSKSGLTRVIDRMEKAGLVRRVVRPRVPHPPEAGLEHRPGAAPHVPQTQGAGPAGIQAIRRT